METIVVGLVASGGAFNALLINGKVLFLLVLDIQEVML